MKPKKPKAVKPVKAWIIVDEEGDWMTFDIYEHKPNSQEYHSSWRIIPVLITPIERRKK